MDIKEIMADREKYTKELQNGMAIIARLQGIIAYLDQKLKEAQESSKKGE